MRGRSAPTSALVDTWAAFRASVPWAIACQQYNLVGSHDTPRIRSVVGEDPGLVRLALGVLLTYPGIPGLFYGDQIRLTGESELAARRPMIWDGPGRDEELHAFVRTLVHLRRDSPALREGGFQVLAAETDTLAYQRDVDGGTVIVVAHRGSAPRPAGGVPVREGGVADGVRFTDVVSGGRAIVADGRLALPRMSAGIAIWRAVTA